MSEDMTVICIPNDKLPIFIDEIFVAFENNLGYSITDTESIADITVDIIQLFNQYKEESS